MYIKRFISKNAQIMLGLFLIYPKPIGNSENPYHLNRDVYLYIIFSVFLIKSVPFFNCKDRNQHKLRFEEQNLSEVQNSWRNATNPSCDNFLEGNFKRYLPVYRLVLIDSLQLCIYGEAKKWDRFQLYLEATYPISFITFSRQATLKSVYITLKNDQN